MLDKEENHLEEDSKEENENLDLLSNEIKEKEKSMEDIVSNGYCTPYPILATLMISLYLIGDGLTMTLISLLIIPIQGKFDLSRIESLIVISSVFLGVAIGSLIINPLTNKFKRKHIIIVSLFFVVLFHLLGAAFKKIILFSLCRILTGFNVGIIKPILLNIFGEYLPVKIRGFFLVAIWFFFGLGQLLFDVIVYCEMPNFESEKLNRVIFFSSIPIIVSFISSFFLLYDSPRNLILKNENEEAFKILTSMNHGIALTENEKNKMIKTLISQEKEKSGTKVSICDLYKPEFRTQTILLSISTFFVSALFYGILNISSLTMKELHKENNLLEYKDIIEEQIVMAVLGAVTDITSGLYCEYTALGRKGFSIATFILSGIFYLCAILFPRAYYLLLVAGFTVANTLINIIGTMLIEVYPTWIRDTSTSFIYMHLRFFSFLVQFLYLGLFKVNYKIDYYLSFAFSLIGAVLIYFLPNEPSGKPLDTEMSVLHTKEK